MAKVRLDINGRGYDMVAEDGQESHVMQLGEDVAKRVKNIVHQVGQVGEGRVILMAALQLADELKVLGEKAAQLEDLTKAQHSSRAALEEARTYVAEVYGDIADKLESLTATLEE